MKHLSLFSGIGGFDLAAQWMGWENMAHCEINPFCRTILNYYWPNAISYEDIKTTDFSVWRGVIDIVTGGFPCQPFSLSGARKGTEDDRHLWPEMLRAIREIQPRYIVGENVYGLFNWNEGMVFEQVQIDLEAEGYEVQPVIIPACAVGAPHRRDRIWFVAYAKHYGCNCSENGQGDRKRNNYTSEIITNTNCGGYSRLQYKLGEIEKIRQGGTNNDADSQQSISNTLCIGQQGQGRPEKPINPAKGGNWEKYRAFDDDRWPTQSPVRRGDDGISERLDGITFSNWAKASIEAYGNAIVPQVAYQIFKAIEATL